MGCFVPQHSGALAVMLRRRHNQPRPLPACRAGCANGLELTCNEQAQRASSTHRQFQWLTSFHVTVKSIILVKLLAISPESAISLTNETARANEKDRKPGC